ncbi:MAG: ABC transporter permease [Solirubrobacteraceae bacterium]
MSRLRNRRSGLLSLLRQAARSGQGAIGLALAGLVVVIAVVGPLVEPHGPTALVSFPFDAPSSHALLGTDAIGRDVLSRVLSGGLTILLLAAAATALGVGGGALLGITAGYWKGAVDETVMRLLDVALGLPQLLLALVLLSLVGPKLWLVCVAVALIHAPQTARVIRAATLRSVEEDFVVYAEALGTRRRRMMTREILPNVVAPLMVETGLRFTYSIALVASLSFLGFGLQPPGADWGLMISENRLGLAQNPWPVVVPVLILAVITIGVNLFTDAISRVALGVSAPLAASDAESDRVAAAAVTVTDSRVQGAIG